MNLNTTHLSVGTLLAGGKYRIVRFIGAGGFGCTYEAEFVPMSSRVAIKEFFVGSCCNREATGAVSVGILSQSALVGRLEDKFRTEAKRLFNLKHPGIVSVTDILEENGTSYYVMDFILGRSLQSVIDCEGPLHEARALRYISQVMEALEYVHGKNMLHLDIKPDNIMIEGETDSAILIDFGVSKQYDEIDGHNTSTIMGQTPGYAPPEQAGNSLRQFTPAADIYALGATLYTALTGCVPPSSPDLISGVASLEPLPTGTNTVTQEAINRMMQPNVTQRPQTIAAVRNLLGNVVRINVPISSVPTAPTDDMVASNTISSPETVAAPYSEWQASNQETQTVHFEEAPNYEDPSDDIDEPQLKLKKWLWGAIAAVAVVAVFVAIFFTRTSSDAEEDAISGMENDHEWVDMGTSVKWATTNVGASSSTSKGSHFAWGEISPKSEYTKDNCLILSEGMTDISGVSSYDVARAKWGGNWRMPTQEEFQELIDKCIWTWDGNGYQVMANNGNTIYLPAAGYCKGTKLYLIGDGCYWSATSSGVIPGFDHLGSYCLSFRSDTKDMAKSLREIGRSVRPVF
ncbi:MAG: serine/threonine protein kinase [Muribaculaceae bacterium]|nr:serine/threonine protein kinase [Muribaculaceae bacterium]